MSYPLVQIKRVARVVNGGTPTPAEENWNGSVLWATPVDLNKVDGGFISNTDRCLSDIGVETGSVKVPAGSVILSTRAPIGYAAVAQNAISFNQGCKALVPHRPDETDSRYLRYAVQSSVEQLQVLGKGSTFLELSTQDLGSFRVPWPSYSEQVKIADQLDRELVEIDGLIADQLYLQELLSERWTSLTFELATDASNPDRYETGHPFWKTLPKGWTLQKLGWHFKIGNGSTPKSDNPEYWTDNADNGFPWFNSSVVNNEVAGTPSRYVTTKALNECHLPFVPQGSLLVGLTGQGKTRGMVTKTGIDSTINQHVAYLHAYKTSDLNIDFVKLCLQATYPMLRFISDGNGSTKGALTCDSLNHFSLPVPPVNHQRKSINLFKNQQITNNSLMKSSAELINILEEVKNPRTKLVEI